MTDPILIDSPASQPSSFEPNRKTASGWTWAAFGVALIALAGSLLLSLGMNLRACPLCVYQRTFVMGVVAVLAIGLPARPRPGNLVSLLALPLAAAGVTVVGFHEYLEWTGRLECPGGFFGIGTAPQQSLVALTVLLALVGIAVARSPREVNRPGLVVAGAILLGVLLAVAAIASAPPAPKATKPYEGPLDMCRPPYRAP